MKKAILVSLCALLTGLSAFPQDTPAPNSPVHVVYGKDNPSLIPDAVAYRLVFLRLSLPATPTTADRQRQKFMFRDIGLNDNEVKAVTPILQDFRTQFDQRVITSKLHRTPGNKGVR